MELTLEKKEKKPVLGRGFTIFYSVDKHPGGCKNNDDLRRLSKAIKRTAKTVKARYKDESIANIKEWR